MAASPRVPLKIGTHDGVFHCDESLACFMLQQLPEYKDALIVRSRDNSQLDECDIVVDVGRVYDHAAHRYDHHQSSFGSTLSSIFPSKTFGDIKLSSAGLVYAHFGHQIIGQLLQWPMEDPKTDKVFDMVYEQLIKEIDAIDNGVNMCEGEPRYHISTHLSARVACLKPNWNEESSAQILYRRFLEAVKLTGQEFLDRVLYYGQVWMPARVVVLDAFNQRLQHDPSGRILVLPQSVPWIQHLFEIEAEQQLQGHILYLLFQDKDWRIRAVPLSPESFELRRAMCAEWRGLVNEELDRKTNIEGGVFVHASGFIGGHKTLEGALAMARKCIQ